MTEVKKRFRSHQLKFNEPLSNSLLEDLPNNRNFFTKYQNIEPIQVGKNIIGIIVKDSFNIHYNISQEDIKATSPVQPDDRVIDKLQLLGDRIIEIYGLDSRSYKIHLGPDYEYFHNIDLTKAIIEDHLIDKLIESSVNTSKLSLISCKFALEPEMSDSSIFSVQYANPEDFTKQILLVEAEEEYIEKLKGIFKDLSS